MVIAKCEKCGQEYELGEDENPADYQCECGGDLKHAIASQPTNEPLKSSEKSSEGIFNMWNKQPTIIKAISIIGVFLVLLVLIVGITGMFNPTSNTVQTPTTTASNNTTTPQAQAGTVTLKNLKIERYSGIYTLTTELTPTENFDYLTMVVKYYKSGSTTLVFDRVMAWNMSSAKKGETYSILFNDKQQAGADKADILVFDSPNTQDDSKAIYKNTISIANLGD